MRTKRNDYAPLLYRKFFYTIILKLRRLLLYTFTYYQELNYNKIVSLYRQVKVRQNTTSHSFSKVPVNCKRTLKQIYLTAHANNCCPSDNYPILSLTQKARCQALIFLSYNLYAVVYAISSKSMRDKREYSVERIIYTIQSLHRFQCTNTEGYNAIIACAYRFEIVSLGDSIVDSILSCLQELTRIVNVRHRFRQFQCYRLFVRRRKHLFYSTQVSERDQVQERGRRERCLQSHAVSIRQ